MVALVGYSVAYGFDLGYRYEVAVIVIDWLALIITGVLLSLVFRRATREPQV